MKKVFFLTAICAVLTACGGGSGGGSSNGGSDPSPSPTPTPTNTTCTLPANVIGTTYYGASVNGITGTWSIADAGNGALTVSGTGAGIIFNVTPTSNGCNYTNSAVADGVAGTFNEFGIIATTAVSGGHSYPALAVSSPENTADAATAAKIGGTYLMVNYEEDNSSGLSYSSYYRQVVISSTLSNGAIVGTLDGLHTLEFVPNSGGNGYDMKVDGTSEGITAYFKTVGTETILVLGVNSSTNRGIWIGTNAPVSSFNSGLYVDNGMDNAGYSWGSNGTVNQSNSTSFVGLTSNTIIAENTYTISPNTPTGTNFYSVAFANEPNSVGIASALGLTAIAGQWGPHNGEQVSGASPSMVFLLKPKQTQQ